MTSRSTYRICTLCEATCGIEVRTEGERIDSIRGDRRDPFSRGYICPKAHGLIGLHEDPDRLRAPVKRTATGFETIGWDEAFVLANDGLAAARRDHGNNGVGAYLGNPTAHSLHGMLYAPVLLKALATKQVYSASSADQLPKMITAGAMFGAGLSVPVPDLDRTDFLLVLGANPLASNGSLMTAPDVKGRLRAIRDRGGSVIVVDPRRTETAIAATEHHFIRPGTDALFLLSMCHVMFAEGLVSLGDQVAPHARGLDEVRSIVEAYPPERIAGRCGIASDEIARITRELCAAKRAACYGRIGTTCQEFGTLASWAVDLVNLLSGNLDRAGGAMFTRPAATRGASRVPLAGGRGVTLGRWQSRVAGLPESFGELPVCALADEILEAGDGQIRAMITFAGNPLSSAPNVSKLTRAFESLDFMVSVDFYINETTRFADVILPPPSPLERDTYDISLYHFAVRNVAKYSQAALPRDPSQPDEWEILLTLAKAAMGMQGASIEQADDFVAKQLAEREIGDGGRWTGLSADEALAGLAPRRGPARLLDLLLRVGHYGDGFGRQADGLTLAALEAAPHGIDLGALTPGVPEVLRTADGLIDMAPSVITADLPRLEGLLEHPPSPLVLIGRRHLRSNNSWMHNVHSLVKGKARCTLLMHAVDAAEHGVQEGDTVKVASRVGALCAPIVISDEMMPGVVSLPHGWGHDLDGVVLSVAKEHAGVNVNMLSDDEAIDAVSGNAAFNGVPVTVTRVTPA